MVTRSRKERWLYSTLPFITFLGSWLPFTPNLFHLYRLQRFCVDQKKENKQKKPQNSKTPPTNPHGWQLHHWYYSRRQCWLGFSNLMFVLAAWKAWFLSWKGRKIDPRKETKLEFLLPSIVLLISFRTQRIQPFSRGTEENVALRSVCGVWPGAGDPCCAGPCCAAVTTWVIRCCRGRELGLLWLYLGSLFLINK